MKYNRALDLLCAAAEFHMANKPNSAAKAFMAACKDPSIKAALSLVEANNSVAHAKLVASAKIQSAKRRKVRAGLEDSGMTEDQPGEELRVEVEDNGDRIIQESDFDDMVGDDDFDEDEILSSADEDEDDEEDDEDEEEEKKEASVKAKAAPKAPAKAATKAVSTTATANFAQALKNFDALARKK